MYKICHGIVDINQNSYLRPYINCRVKTCSSYNYKFLNVNAAKDAYFYPVFPCTLRICNKLPLKIELKVIL